MNADPSSSVFSMPAVLIGVVILLIGAAMVWIAIRVVRQWKQPQKRYESEWQDIQRRKQALGIDDKDN